jgi:alpha-galactosidase
MDGHQERRTQYQVKLTGEELHILTPGRGGRAPSESVAHRTAPGEGTMPAKIPVPALHKVPYNGLAKTPPMGWNSWNKFASRVDDGSVRGMADAVVSSGMKDAGYVYINIDDTWEGERDSSGNITSNKKSRI